MYCIKETEKPGRFRASPLPAPGPVFQPEPQVAMGGLVHVVAGASTGLIIDIYNVM